MPNRDIAIPATSARNERDVALDVPGRCYIRCFGADAHARVNQLNEEVKQGASWLRTAGRVSSVRNEGPNRANGRAL